MKITLNFLKLALVVGVGTVGVLSALALMNSTFVNSSSTYKTNKSASNVASSLHAIFEPYNDAEKYSQAKVIAIVKVMSWGDTVMTPGDLPFTKINLQIERKIFSAIETPIILSVFHEGSPTKQYDNFKLPEIGKKYLVFLNHDNQLQGLQIRDPESIYDLVDVNGSTRAIKPYLKENLGKLHGHKKYNEMPEFKENQYVTLKTGEKVKLTASRSLDDLTNEITTICGSPGKCGISSQVVPSPERE